MFLIDLRGSFSLIFVFAIRCSSLCTTFSNVNLKSLAHQATIRKESIFSYDISKFDFTSCVKEILEDYSGENIVSLDELHRLPGCGGVKFLKNKDNPLMMSRLQHRWNIDRGRHDDECIKRFGKFDILYRKFITEEIGPRLGGGRILFQRAPTIRIYLPNKRSSPTVLHNDCEYHHQPSEMNYWLLISSSSFGNNTMWLESEPDLSDFHPLELVAGQYCRFYGNKCRHFSYPNDTGKTRISIDFRALSDLTGPHDPTFDSGVPRGSKARYDKCFDIGGYYDIIDIEKEHSKL